VIGDSVNPWMLTRDAWRDSGLRAGTQIVEVEILCTDREKHRRRIAPGRAIERYTLPGLILPDWQAVIQRAYHHRIAIT
jgi:hypothetical protein